MSKIFSNILFLIVLFSFACNEGNQRRNDEQIPIVEINSQSDSGTSIKLHILKKEIKQSLFVYTVVSMDSNRPIGFIVEVPINIEKFGEGIRLMSLGDTSDNFLSALSRIYQVGLEKDSKFIKSISCNYAGLNDLIYKGDGQGRDNSINYVKLFFEGAGEDDYAELYLNINESAKTVELEEKDSEYRPYIIKILTAH